VTAGILGLLIVIVSWVGLADVTFMADMSPGYKVASSLGIMAFFIFAIGPLMKKIFNSPEMHIWHHSYALPESRITGVNFGLTLAIWDYLFGTAHVPHDGRDIELGFPGIEDFPTDFKGQVTHGF